MVAAAAVGLVLYLVERFTLAPMYRAATGFLPFDLQRPLSHFMIGIELGAFDKGAALEIYTAFATIDVALMLAKAAAITLLWLWLFEKAPQRLFNFLKRGGVAMVPSYVVILDGAAKAGFHRLLQGLSGEALTETIEFCATIHRLQLAVADIRNGLTVLFIALAGVKLFFGTGAAAPS